MISGNQIYCYKLKKDTKLLSDKLPAPTAFAIQPPKPAVLHKLLAEKIIESNNASKDKTKNVKKGEARVTAGCGRLPLALSQNSN